MQSILELNVLLVQVTRYDTSQVLIREELSMRLQLLNQRPCWDINSTMKSRNKAVCLIVIRMLSK
jgi:hypothetical protein